MKRFLGKKQISNSADWQFVYDNIEDFVSYQEIEAKTKATVERIKRVIAKKGYKRIGYGWSGGKDSLVMYGLIKLSGIPITKGLCVLFPTEYPEMRRWLREHAPADCEFRETSKFTLEQINADNEYLFPNQSKYISAYNPPRWKVQNEFKEDYGMDVMLTGRRCIDGNFCGGSENDFISTNKSGDSFNIIADWSHEEILGFIKYNHLELPPCYFYPNSWRFGTHCWTERKRLGEYPFTENLDEIFKIDKTILFDARNKLEVVDRYLNEKGL